MITRRQFGFGLAGFGTWSAAALVAGHRMPALAQTGRIEAFGAGTFAAQTAGAPLAGKSGPAAAGFHTAPEGGLNARSFLQWPGNPALFADAAMLEKVQADVVSLANTIAGFEPVVVLADAAAHAGLRSRLTGKAELWDIATDSPWAGDTFPAFLVNARGELAASAFRFNGWGASAPHERDALVAASIAARLGLDLYDSGVTGEMGGVISDGGANLVAFESSWANPNRNMLLRDAIGERLKTALGARNIAWAPGVMGKGMPGLAIGMLARFTPSGAILMQLPDVMDEADPDSVAAYRAFDAIAEASHADGHKFEIAIVPAPLEPRALGDDGTVPPGFTASYVNCHVANGAVICPQYGDEETDRAAIETLGELYPGREIVPLAIDGLASAGGGIGRAVRAEPVSTGMWKPA